MQISGTRLAGALAVVVVVVVATVGGGWWLTRDQATTPTPSAAAQEGTNGERVAQTLAQLPENPEKFLAPSAREFVGDRAAEAVPAGSKVDPEPDTWAPDGMHGGVIEAVVTGPDGTKVRYVLVVELDADGDPLVVATFPTDDPPRAPDKGADDVAGDNASGKDS